MGTNIISTSVDSRDVRRVLDGFRMVVRALRVSSRSCEKTARRTGAQVFLLQQLRRDRGVSVNELARRTFTHQSTVSEIVGRLVRDGLVARSVSKQDARSSELRLTTKGERLLKTVPRLAHEDLARAVMAFEPAKRKALALLLSELVLEAGFAEAKPPLFFEGDT